MIHEAARPGRVTLVGNYTALVPLIAEAHDGALWAAVGGEENDSLWDYLGDGPYRDRAEFRRNLETKELSVDPMFFAILSPAGGALGYASLMRIEPKHGAIEVGNINYGPALQKTPAGTEAMYLLAQYVFEKLGYRRYEWKCNSLNEPSRRAAARYGFQYEGVFRQHMVVKGKNRDTAWFSMLDSEWPARKSAFENWLSPDNFDTGGRQRSPLSR